MQIKKWKTIAATIVVIAGTGLVRGADATEVIVKIVIDKVEGFIKSKVIDTHRLIPPVEVKGQWVYVLPLVDYSGSRATDNFAAKWPNKQFPKHQLYILNCPDEHKKKVTFVLKADKGGVNDGTRMDGKEFGDGDIMWFDSNDNYLANRKGVEPKDGDIRHLLALAPNATVILVPEGMSRDEAVEGLKKHFELKK